MMTDDAIKFQNVRPIPRATLLFFGMVVAGCAAVYFLCAFRSSLVSAQYPAMLEYALGTAMSFATLVQFGLNFQTTVCAHTIELGTGNFADIFDAWFSRNILGYHAMIYLDDYGKQCVRWRCRRVKVTFRDVLAIDIPIGGWCCGGPRLCKPDVVTLSHWIAFCVRWNITRSHMHVHNGELRISVRVGLRAPDDHDGEQVQLPVHSALVGLQRLLWSGNVYNVVGDRKSSVVAWPTTIEGFLAFAESAVAASNESREVLTDNEHHTGV